MLDNINYIINKIRPNSHVERISANNKLYHQPSSIANALNNHFCNVASDLASALPKPNRHYRSYLTRYINKFSLSKVSEVEVFLLLENLDKKIFWNTIRSILFYYQVELLKFLSL